MDEKFVSLINKSLVYVDSVAKTHSIMKGFEGKNIRVSYSGGSDSDTIMWLLKWLGYDVTAVFYNTGLEYDATWRHLDYMRSKGFKIDVTKAKVPIPTGQKLYGHPFISKYVSEMLYRLQRHNFDFQKDGVLTYEVLKEKFPKAQQAVKWWSNKNNLGGRYNIDNNKLLRDFLIEYGLPFRVSGRCCEGAKKKPVMEYAKENGIDLFVMGVRRAENGIRGGAYKSCFVPKKSYDYSMYFPLFWWKNADKELFDKEMNIKHSDAYGVYGLKRTGCVACPFGRNFVGELKAVEINEPKLAKGMNNIFGKSQEWTIKYREYRDK